MAPGPHWRAGIRQKQAGIICTYRTTVLGPQNIYYTAIEGSGRYYIIIYRITDPKEQGWTFTNDPGAIVDEINGATYLHEVYTKTDQIIQVGLLFLLYGTKRIIPL